MKGFVGSRGLVLLSCLHTHGPVCLTLLWHRAGGEVWFVSVLCGHQVWLWEGHIVLVSTDIICTVSTVSEHFLKHSEMNSRGTVTCLCTV